MAETGLEWASRLHADAALEYAVDPMLDDAANLKGDAAHLIGCALSTGRELLARVARRAKLQLAPMGFVLVDHPAV